MKFAKALCVMSLLAVALAASASALVLREEHVTGGALDLVWLPGFNTPQSLQPLTISTGHPAFPNPSGDGTVAVATNAVPDSGGIVLTVTDPAGVADYSWEAWFFTGDGNTRRGLVVRANPANNFTSCYQFVIQSGLFQINFRKLVDQTPTTLGTWFSNTLPGGVPAVNTWHHMKVTAVGGTFRCFFDGTELTSPPIVDTSLADGWVGVYNFRFDLGGVPVYFDDMVLNSEIGTPTRNTTWGSVKQLYK